MSPSSHQSARLARGNHSRPEDGMCVMELASMLAGEEFSDHPRSVCPVVAGFLRSYNDGVADTERDDLYRFAAEAVGTHGSAEVMAARAALCHDWIVDRQREMLRRSNRLLRGRVMAWAMRPGRPHDPSLGALAGRLAARITQRGCQGAHASALTLIERMLDPELERRVCGQRPDDRGDRGAEHSRFDPATAAPTRVAA